MSKPRAFHETLSFADRDISFLLNELELCNMHLYDSLFGNPQRELRYESIRLYLQKAEILNNLIKNKSLFQKEEFFRTEVKFLYIYIRREEYEEAAKFKKRLDYYRHCFLEGSGLFRTNFSPMSLKKILESC